MYTFFFFFFFFSIFTNTLYSLFLLVGLDYLACKITKLLYFSYPVTYMYLYKPKIITMECYYHLLFYLIYPF